MGRPALVFPSLASLPERAPSPPEGWVARLKDAGLSLTEAQLERLRDFVGLFVEANGMLNLSAIRKPPEIWNALIFDSLMLLPTLAGLSDKSRVVDVGCGGGFPGLPLAVVEPRLSFSLLDATSKKIAFVQHVVEQLELGHVTAIAGRAEELAASSSRTGARHRERYDLVTARAVAGLPMLLELTAPFAKSPVRGEAGGCLALVKGGGADEELVQAGRAMRELSLVHTGTVTTPTGKIVMFSKMGTLASRYPRPNGVPKRNPL